MAKYPKGKLLIIGGAEDKGADNRPDIGNDNKEFKPYEILEELLPDGKKSKSIEVITTASAKKPIEIGEDYLETFDRLGFGNVGLIQIGNKEDGRDRSFMKRVEKAHAVLFPGGDQFRLATILGCTDVLDVIMNKYYTDEDFIVAGTSAGAMAMAKVMIYRGDSNEALLKGDLAISAGLGLLDYCIIDTHFVRRGRFGRLAQAVLMNPACIGIGLGEDTALIISRGNRAECRGSGMVTIIDGKQIRHTNIAYAEEKTPLCVENLKVHILCKGNGFLLKERKFLPKKEDIEKEKETTGQA
jgi:cyanophycinase